jgi:hypothetical protein
MRRRRLVPPDLARPVAHALSRHERRGPIVALRPGAVMKFFLPRNPPAPSLDGKLPHPKPALTASHPTRHRLVRRETRR